MNELFKIIAETVKNNSALAVTFLFGLVILIYFIRDIFRQMKQCWKIIDGFKVNFQTIEKENIIRDIEIKKISNLEEDVNAHSTILQRSLDCQEHLEANIEEIKILLNKIRG